MININACSRLQMRLPYEKGEGYERRQERGTSSRATLHERFQAT
jgi:hypothetical protein